MVVVGFTYCFIELSLNDAWLIAISRNHKLFPRKCNYRLVNHVPIVVHYDGIIDTQ